MANSIPHRSGIYRIDVPSGGTYVGQAKDLHRRRKDHFVRLRSGSHKNPRLQRSFDKYSEAVSFVVVLICPTDRDLLAYYEKSVFDLEVSRRGGTNLLNVHTNDMRSRLGIPQSEESNRKRSIAMKGRPRTASQIEAVRLSNRTRTISQATREKHSVLMIGNKLSLGYVQTDDHKRRSTHHFCGRKKPAEEVARAVATRRQRAEERGFWLSPNTIMKMRETLTGRKLSQEHRGKIGASGIGRSPSDETRVRLSLAQKTRRNRERAERGENGRD